MAQRWVEEVEIALRYAGVPRSSHVIHVGWAETVNLPWGQLEMAHTVANHHAGAAVLEDMDAPSPPELCRFTTNHIEAGRSALNRRGRKMRRMAPGSLRLGLTHKGVAAAEAVPLPLCALRLDTRRMVDGESWGEARAADMQ